MPLQLIDEQKQRKAIGYGQPQITRLSAIVPGFEDVTASVLPASTSIESPNTFVVVKPLGTKCKLRSKQSIRNNFYLNIIVKARMFMTPLQSKDQLCSCYIPKPFQVLTSVLQNWGFKIKGLK